jgi:hypothetical protein
MGTLGFSDVDERLAELPAKGDDLERFRALVDFRIIPGATGIGVASRFILGIDFGAICRLTTLSDHAAGSMIDRMVLH